MPPRRRPVRRIQKQSEVIAPLDPNEDFSDVAGDPNSRFALVDADDSRAYAWAHDSRDSIGELQRTRPGYRVEYFTEGGPRPAGMDPAEIVIGDRMTVGDHVCMSAVRALVEKRKRYLINENRQTWKGKQRAANADLRQGLDGDTEALPAGVSEQLRARQQVSTMQEAD